MHASSYYIQDCPDCGTFTPSSCKKCKSYQNSIFEKALDNNQALNAIHTIKKYYKDKNKIIEDDGLFTWEDYEK